MKLRLLPAVTLAFTLAALNLGQAAPNAEDVAETDANITRLTTEILEHAQFSQHPLDQDLAGKLLNEYLDTLDRRHVLFLQSDVAIFFSYRPVLAQQMRTTGDTTAAQAIFACYLKRLEQRTEFVINFLKSAKFDFTGNEAYPYDREKALPPQNLTAATALWAQQLRAEYLQEKLTDEKPDEIVRTLSHRYTQQLQSMQKLSQGEALEIYLNALAHVYDPHSDYFGHEEYDNFSINMNLSLFGIGATLESEDGYCRVVDLVPGGPAARSGLLKPGDRIVAVAQGDQEPVSLISLPASRAVELIRGPKGTVVHLSIIPAGRSEDSAHQMVTLVRDQVKLEDQQAKAQIVDLPNTHGRPLRLGVIDLPSFYADMNEARGTHRTASKDVAKLLEKLQTENVEGVILDLRHNGGGSLEEAIKLTGLFINEGPVVQTRGPKGDIEVDSDTDPSIAYDGPLIVLTSRYSASASEILAGALQDYGRAIVAGDTTTFGKGTVQSILPLTPIMDQNNLNHAYDPGALKLTIRKFYRPSGASTQLKGVASDIVLPSLSNMSDVNESSLKNPLPWDIIPPADYLRLNRVQPYLADLIDKSSRRMASEKGFTYLQNEFTQLESRLKTKLVSLNEVQRRKEIAEIKSLQNESVKEVQALQATRLDSYEITLANATLPGLPPAELPHNPPTKTKNEETNRTSVLATDPNWMNDLVLTEAEHILADYVNLLHCPPTQATL